jgi:hypothetical protein
MTRNLNRETPLTVVGQNVAGLVNETQKPVLGSFQVFVGDYVSPGDPGNDPPGTSPSSPTWQNGFTWVAGFPVWFAHGVDGETDMGGMYDLITGSPVSGTVAFTMPLEWATQAEPYHPFVALLDDSDPDQQNWVYGMAAQIINQTTGAVRIYWPIVATPYP